MGIEKDKEHAKRDARAAARGNKLRLGFNDFRFVRLDLTEAEKADLRSTMARYELSATDLEALRRDGYSLRISSDRDSDTALVSLSQPNGRHPNAGLILTARGRNTATALASLAYKLFIVIGERAWADVEAERDGAHGDSLG